MSCEDATGIEEEQINANINIYPNPSSGIINLSSEKFDLSSTSLIIKDITGKVVNQFNQTITTLNLDNGVYIFSFKQDNNIVHNAKVVVIR